MLLYSRPDLMHHILGVTAAVTAYLNAQIEAGAQAVMIFDSVGRACWLHDAYKEFLLVTSSEIIAGLTVRRTARRSWCIVHQGRRPVAGRHRRQRRGMPSPLTDGGYRRRARRLVGDKVALQGNLDPAVLFGTPEAVAAETKKVLDAFGPQ